MTDEEQKAWVYPATEGRDAEYWNELVKQCRVPDMRQQGGMNADEQKAWEELVIRGIEDVGFAHKSMIDETIGAADAELTALRARVTLLEKVAEAAYKWHEHDRECTLHRFRTGELDYCSCGLRELRAALDAAKEG